MNGQHKATDYSANWLPAFIVGLLFGGMAGAAAMLLLAPRSGKKTRAELQKQGAKLRDQAVEGMEDVVAEAGDKAHQFTDSVQKGVGGLQHQAQDLISDVRK